MNQHQMRDYCLHREDQSSGVHGERIGGVTAGDDDFGCDETAVDVSFALESLAFQEWEDVVAL